LGATEREHRFMGILERVTPMKNEVDKQVLQLDVHRHEKCVTVEYQSKRKYDWGKKGKYNVGPKKGSRLPKALFVPMTRTMGMLTKSLSTDEKTFDTMKPLLQKMAFRMADLFGGSVGNETKYGCTLYLPDGKKFLRLLFLDCSAHRLTGNIPTMLHYLRSGDSGKAGSIFRKMERKSPAPLRGACVVMSGGSFWRYIPADPRVKKVK
jgi:hypothetical protein